MRVDFVELEDGPLIRFYATQQQAFAILHGEVERLANGVIAFSRLHENDAFEMANGLYLVLMAGENRGAHQLDDCKFSWELTPPQWSVVAGLIEPFTHDATRGRFQWLAGPEARYSRDAGDTAVLLSCSLDGSW